MEPSFFELKKCTKCGEEKPATTEFFYVCKKVKNGIEAICKTCKSFYCKEWRKKNSEKEKLRLKKRNENKKSEIPWRIKNPEKYKNLRKRCYERNKEKIVERSKQWAISNPKRVKKLREKYREELTDSVVRSKLKLKKDECPPELIEVKRLQLKIHRLCKTSKT